MTSTKVYQVDYYGFVYIWRDNQNNKYYIGSHLGPTTDSYIASNKWLRDAYKKRPQTFKRRVISYLTVSGQTSRETIGLLHNMEQMWLNMIKDDELATSVNVITGAYRYYNMKKTAAGGSHKGHTKNRSKPSWNKGPTSEMIELRRQGLFCILSDKPKTKRVKVVQPKRHKFRNTSLVSHTCEVCNNPFIGPKQRKLCSKSCSARLLWQNQKGRITPRFVKGQTAWNKGLENLTAANNGRKGAQKQSQKVMGRRMVSLDGRRKWAYPGDPEYPTS